jgi:hypothetical protein
MAGRPNPGAVLDRFRQLHRLCGDLCRSIFEGFDGARAGGSVQFSVCTLRRDCVIFRQKHCVRRVVS